MVGALKGFARAAVTAAVFSLLIFAPGAFADSTFGIFGSGPGQTKSPKGVAVDNSTGNVYVADSQNNRIDVFQSDGTFLFAFGWGVADGSAKAEVCTTSCQAGLAGSGAGELSTPSALAADSASHSIYVTEPGNGRIQKFDSAGSFQWMVGKGVNTGTSGKPNLCTNAGAPTDICGSGEEGSGAGEFNAIKGIGVGPAGIVYVMDTAQTGIENKEGAHKGDAIFAKRLQRLSPSGVPLEQVVLTDSRFGNIGGFAVDSETGDFYIASFGGVGVQKYSTTGTLLAEFSPSFNINALAVDSVTGSVYVADVTGIDSINEYDSGGKQLRAFGYGSLEFAVAGMSFQSVSGDVCTSQGSGTSSRIVCFKSSPAAGPIVLPEEGRTFADQVGNVRATLHVEINPEGKETKVHFEYVDDATYQKDIEEFGPGHGFDHAVHLPQKPEEDISVGSGFEPHSGSLKIGCLDPQNDEEVGKCLVPQTLYHFRAVTTNEDALAGNVGPEAEFTTVTAPEFLPPSWATEVGLGSAVVHATLDPLGIPTTGRFQYEATFKAGGFAEAEESAMVDFGAGEGPTSAAAQLTHLAPGTTYRYRILATNFAGDTPGLEGSFRTFPSQSVIPACPNDAFRTGPSAKLPDCRAYEMVSPVDKENGDITVLLSTPDQARPAEIAQAEADGGGLAYASYRSFGDAKSAPYTVQYLATRLQGSGWTSHSISPQREGASVTSGAALDTQYRFLSKDLCQGWLITDSEPVLAPGGVPGFANLYHRQSCGEERYEALSTVQPPSQPPIRYFPEPQGTCAAGARVVFRANDALTEDASAAVDGASRPIFQLYGSSGSTLRLLSVLPEGEASGKPSSAGTGTAVNGSGFRHDSLIGAVSGDCGQVFWTASNTDAGPGTIYLRKNPFTAGEECTGPASPCTVPVSQAVGGLEANEPAQFWAGAPDGSRAIFSLASHAFFEYDSATETPHPIAGKLGGVLGASEDASSVYFTSAEALAPKATAGDENIYLHESGKPGSTFIATMSSPQAGICFPANTDPYRRCARVSSDGEKLAFMSSTSLSGEDTLDAVSGEKDAEIYLYDAGEERLRCVSCNPSGGRPEGRGIEAFGHLNWIAAQLPTPKSALYFSHALSFDGRRLFFESYDALLPRDTNGRRDVYEWEMASDQEACQARGADLYVPSADGCLSLISSGKDEKDAEFVDASTTGDDVFFKTSQGLVAQDPGLIDIYDARVNGGFPPPATLPPPCEGEACQPPVSPRPPQRPSSLGYVGPGNLEERAKSLACAKGKRKVRKHGRAVCVKEKAKHPKRQRQVKKSGRADR